MVQIAAVLSQKDRLNVTACRVTLKKAAYVWPKIHVDLHRVAYWLHAHHLSLRSSHVHVKLITMAMG